MMTQYKCLIRQVDNGSYVTLSHNTDTTKTKTLFFAGNDRTIEQIRLQMHNMTDVMCEGLFITLADSKGK